MDFCNNVATGRVYVRVNVRRRGVACVAVFVGVFWTLSLLQPTAAVAQFGVQIQGQQAGRFIEPPRAILQVISDAERAIEAGRMSEAVVRLGDMLARQAVAAEDADLAGQDFFLNADETQSRVSISMMREAERVLASLPADGIEMYELRYGANAKRLLDEASESRDREKLILLSRRYLLSEAGLDGTLILAQLELSEGRAVAAMAVLRRLASVDAARRRFGDSLLVLLAEAETLAGNDNAATEHLAAANQNGGNYELATEGAEKVASGRESEWLKNQFGSFVESARQGFYAGERANWVARGGASGLGAGDGNLPLSRIRWDVVTTTSGPEQRMLEKFLSDNIADAPPPTWQPIKVGSQLLMRTTERLLAVDFETGIRIWEYPWSNGPVSEDTTSLDIEQLGNLEEAEQLLIQKVWNDLPYGRITSDGQRVYLLDDLGTIEPMSMNQFGGMQMRGSRRSDNSSNTLVALDLASEGKLLWLRGKAGIEPEMNSLAEAFFMGPPLPVEGKLYQLAEIAGDIYLLCLQPETGTELWRQQILGNDGGRVGSDAVRRIAGATPAYSNGIMVCPTGAGAVVAIDLISRTLLWGHKLPQNDNNIMFSRRTNRYNTRLDQASLMNRWLDGTPTICGATVLVTPVESDRIYAFDLLTGTPQWSPILRNDFRYLAGCRGDKFFLVSGSRMQAFNIKTGQPAWSAPATVEDDEQISGTGVFGSEAYFLPTNSGYLVEVELETGKVRGRRDVEFPLGNLLADGDSIVSQSATMLSAAYAEKPLRTLVEERLETDQDDRWAMVRQGELLLEQGDREAAIDWLLKARQLDPSDEEVRVLLVDALLTSIRNGKKADAETTDLLDELIEMTPQRIELLRLKAIAADEDNRPLDVVENLIELSRIALRDEQTYRAVETQYFETSPELKTSIHAWTAAYLQRAISAADAEQLDAINSMVGEFTTPKISQAGSIRRLTLAQFGPAIASDPLRVAMWTAALDDGAYGRAERLGLDALLVADRWKGDVGELKKQWLARLTRTYQLAGFEREALFYARQVANNSSTDDTTIDQDLITQLEQAAPIHQWPAGVRMTVSEDANRSGTARRQKAGSVDIQGFRGVHMANWVPRLERGAMLLRDPRGFDHHVDLQSSSSSSDLVQVVIDGGLMIILTNEEIMAIDLLSLQRSQIDSLLWSRKWWNQSGTRSVASRSDSAFFQETRRSYNFSSNKGGGRIESGVMRLGPIVGRRFFVLQGSDLLAIDTVSGEELWRSRNHDSDAFVVADANAVAIVSSDTGVRLFNPDDGAELKTDLWEPSERIVLATGNHLLTMRNEPFQGNAEADDSENVQRVVRLRAPIDGKEVLEFSLGQDSGPTDAFARIVDSRYLALLTVNGRLILWDLLEGREICDQEVEIGGKLSGFNVIRNRAGLVLALVRRDDRDPELFSGATLTLSEGQEHTDTDGPLIAVGLEDGSVLWRHELEGPWGISVDQPAESPLIVLSRSRISYEDTSKGDRFLELLAIDVRDGQMAAVADKMPIISNITSVQTEVRVQPELELVEVAINRYVFQFQFDDKVTVPEERILDTETLRVMLKENQISAGPLELRGFPIAP